MSTGKQERSIEQQKVWAETVKQRFRLDVLREFEDPGISGDEIELRPGFQAMLAFCQQQHQAGAPVEGILTFDGDRFSRADSFGTGAVLWQLGKAGVSKMFTAEGMIDFENETDRMVWNIKQDASRSHFLKQMSRRILGGQADRAREGKWCGGHIPYGYVLGDDGHLALGERVRYEAVEWMFKTYDEDETSLRQLADELERRGVPKPDGRAAKWKGHSVAELLRNPVYTGELHWGRKRHCKYHTMKGGQAVPIKTEKTPRGKPRKLNKAPEDVLVIPNAHPAIVTRERFERVKRKLKAKSIESDRKGTRRRHPDYPLSGLLFCGDCGSRMTSLTVQIGRPAKAEVRRYECTTYRNQGRDRCNMNPIMEETILPLVFEAVRKRFSDPATVKALRERIRAARKRRDGDQAERVVTLRKQIAERAGKISLGYENLLSIAPDLRPRSEAALRKWEADQAEAQEELRRLEQAAVASAEEDAHVEKALKAFGLLGELVAQANNLPEVRKAVRAYVERVDLTFTQEDRGKRRFSTCTRATVHFRPLGEILGPVAISLETSGAL
jgi:DNA invertase Pin-like site-specific DNA recombinase